ncbi:Dirigent protein 24 [Striga hermonthica]|uniref:Dirigent protein n=1 Tax=Striga hermonthica TaxID=68872 RepID=A0A9N7MN39_STRHE|nr:Dirigent protein 24 [Striga hermonthica]
MAKLCILSRKSSAALTFFTCLFLLSTTLSRSARILDEVNSPPTTLFPADAPESATDPLIPPAPAAHTVSPPPSSATTPPPISFFMHDILGGSRPSGRVVTGVVANSNANNLPFSKANNQIFPINGGVPLNTINGAINNNNYPFLIGLNGNTQQQQQQQQQQQAFVTAGQLPRGLSLQQLMFGSITVVDNEITEGHELGTAVLGRAQGFYITSSSDGTTHTLVLTVLCHGGEVDDDDTVSFFGVHRTATPISHLAIVGGTGKYQNVKGYATIETLPHEDQHTTDGVETITHFTLYVTP